MSLEVSQGNDKRSDPAANSVELPTQSAEQEREPANQRPILKKTEHKLPTKNLSVKFAEAIESDYQISASGKLLARMQIEQKADSAIKTLISIWAKQYARTRSPHPKYVDCVAFNFQPGMTPRYLKYLLDHLEISISCVVLPDASLNNEHKKEFEVYVEKFNQFKQRATIIDNTNVHSSDIKSLMEGTDPCIFILQCDNADPVVAFNSVIHVLKRSKHSLIVFAEPLYGLQLHLIEMAFKIKVRNLVLPRLLRPLNHDTCDRVECELYDCYTLEQCEACHGIPALMEASAVGWPIELYQTKLVETLALWKKPEYVRFRGYYFALFDLIKSEAQIFSKDKLNGSKLSVVDSASMLGFDVSFSLNGQRDCKEKPNNEPETKITHDGIPVLVRALKPLTEKFVADFTAFDVFMLLRADHIKCLELEKRIARAMTKSEKNVKLLGDRWGFLKHSFVADIPSYFSLSPQIVPQVKKNGAPLDLANLESWAASRTREKPPQKTMRAEDWPLLYQKLETNRTILPLALSSLLDCICLYKFARALLFFNAKSSAHNITIDQLKKEIVNCPFLALNDEVRANTQLNGINASTIGPNNMHG